ncbi:hypothetical protein Sjap_022400 [Stephania japonica]|uniref:BRI1 kinase inhibitor 1-like n=1 Tax=Stephania japonica TaxID=461633 RepID=A0AAP0EUI5_9MAGN
MDAQLQNQVMEQSKKPISDIVVSSSSPPSSPSHEFSFTNSLHPSPKLSYKAMSPSSFAVDDDDLSPADHIFFHGHLLPLQFLSHLSHLPITPRSSSCSSDSSDSFSLHIRPDEEDIKEPEKCNGEGDKNSNNWRRNCGRKGGIKGKSWAFFWSGKWIRRSAEVGEKEKLKMKFQVSNVLKKYIKTIRPVSLFGRRKKKSELREQVDDDSFSCNSSLEEMQQWEDREMGFSAYPSPAKNGSPFSPITLHSNNTSNSTMEELQSAIQAAILYCKNSVAKEDHEKLKRPD